MHAAPSYYIEAPNCYTEAPADYSTEAAKYYSAPIYTAITEAANYAVLMYFTEAALSCYVEHKYHTEASVHYTTTYATPQPIIIKQVQKPQGLGVNYGVVLLLGVSSLTDVSLVWRKPNRNAAASLHDNDIRNSRKAPEYYTSKAPEYYTSKAPEYYTSKAPEYYTSKAPEYYTSKAPEYYTSKAPEYYTSKAPEYYTSKAPEYYTSKAPEYYTTSLLRNQSRQTEVPKYYFAPNYYTAAAPSCYVGTKYYTEVPVYYTTTFTTLQPTLLSATKPRLRSHTDAPKYFNTKHPSIISLLRQFRPNAPKLQNLSVIS
ncbi:hypothetical protein DAPPUDRAFT_238135 [Daphnia pulex]|uniref:Uncharacterized protein n=1 Tax=Daphnia pulex TaxID=6669 RepID=E9G6Q7_DAPPU|nr:hypothetical protein DAPPUDRAFT_238135 [Daphnia pulex]|eukprot:EFX84787.1 hypothetical protein DAPPUDRAFT_238135 [Daphnia pulex]